MEDVIIEEPIDVVVVEEPLAEEAPAVSPEFTIEEMAAM